MTFCKIGLWVIYIKIFRNSQEACDNKESWHGFRDNLAPLPELFSFKSKRQKSPERRGGGEMTLFVTITKKK